MHDSFGDLVPGLPCMWRTPCCTSLLPTVAGVAANTAHAPATRAAAEASHMFALLMGDKVGPRRELIERHGSRLALEELDI